MVRCTLSQCYLKLCNMYPHYRLCTLIVNSAVVKNERHAYDDGGFNECKISDQESDNDIATINCERQ